MAPRGGRRGAAAARPAALVVTLLLLGSSAAAAAGAFQATEPLLGDAAAAAAAAAAAGSQAAAAAPAPAAAAPAAAAADPQEKALGQLSRGETTKMLVVFRVTDADVQAQEGAAAAAAAAAEAPAAGAAGARGARATKAAARRAARVRAHAAVKSAVLPMAAASGGSGSSSGGGGGRRAGPSSAAAAASTPSPAAPGVRVARDFAQLPITLVEISSLADYEALSSDPRVAAVAAERAAAPQAVESLAAVFQPEAAAILGGTGSGCTIAVLDQGADYRVADLGSCTSPGVPASCRVVYEADVTPTDDGQLDDPSYHGTNVASIAARAAPGANLIVLDIFDGNLAQSSDIVNGINWVISNKDSRSICSINLSLGDFSDYNAQNPCPTADPVVIALAEARSAGIPAAVASGNKGFKDGIAWPGCAPAAIAVGATYADGSSGRFSCTDEVTFRDLPACFSNAGPGLDLLAPGVNISAGTVTKSGTSMASPMVAAALAVLRAAAPTATVDEVFAALNSTGTPIADPRSGPPFVVAPRINVAAALARITGRDAALAAADGAPPDARVAINFDPRNKPPASGAAWATARSVPVQVFARDLSGVTQMCVGEPGKPSGDACAAGTGFTPFSPAVTFGLSDGDERKSVAVWLRDAAGNSNAAAPASADVFLDSTPPTASVAAPAATRARGVSLMLTGSDNLGAVNSLRWCVSNYDNSGCFYPSDFNSGFSSPMNTTLYLDGKDGPKTAYFSLMDPAGNIGKATAPIVLDTAPPAVALAINGGAAATPSASVSLVITASDAGSGLGQMCASQDGSGAAAACGPFQATTSFDLTGGDGVKTVTVQVSDAAGNSRSASASIILDRSPPANVQVTIAGGAGWLPGPSVTVGVTADDVSGVQAACLSNTDVSANPAGCSPFVPYSPQMPWTLAPGDGPRTVWVVLRDATGLVTPSAASATARVDASPPVGASVSIDGGAAKAARTAVTLTIGGSDAGTGVAAMCVSNTDVSAAPAACAPFVPFQASYFWSLDGSSDGPKTVWVVLRDDAGNVAVPATATITLERVSVGGVSARINGGAAFANARAVTVQLTITDAAAVAGASVCVQDAPAAGACAPFSPLASELPWTLPAGDGRKQVLVTIQYSNGNEGVPIAAEVTLDTTPPAAAAKLVAGPTPLAGGGGGGDVTIQINGSDATSGVSGMCITDSALSAEAAGVGYNGTAVAPGGCADARTFAPFSSRVSLRLAPGSGERRVGVVLSDRAGNVMATPTVVTFTADLGGAASAPRAVLAAGAAATAKRSVQIDVTAPSTAGVTSACVTTKPDDPADACKKWKPFSKQGSQSVQLPGGQGRRTVKVWFKDSSGKVIATPAVASVVLDTKPPSMPNDASGMSVKVDAASTSLNVTWAPGAASDDISGLGGYAVAWRQGGGSPNSKCKAKGSTQVAEVGAADGKAVIGGLSPGQRVKLRLCAIDKAGNRAGGVKFESQTLG